MTEPNKTPSYPPYEPSKVESLPPQSPRTYPQGPLKQAGSTADMIFAGIFLLLSLLCVNFCFYGSSGLFLGISAICIYLCGVVYLFPRRRHFGGYGCISLVLYILCALSLSVSDSLRVKLPVLGAMMVLSSLTVMELMDLRRYPAGGLVSALDWLVCFLIKPIEGLGELSYALFHKESVQGKEEKRNIGPLLLGVGCAIPVLLVVIPLLTRADAAFTNLLNKITGNGSTEPYVTLLFGVILFFLYFGQHFSARYREKDMPLSLAPRKALDTTILISFLSAICLIYVLYLLSQLAYFFNAFAGLLPEDFTFAEYARQGFFEMVFVCLINLLLLLLTLAKARKDRGKKRDREPAILRIFSIFLCLFSLVLIVTAMSKMVLYIRHYGMTHLRLTTSVFMIFLTVMFCTMLLWIFLRKIPYMKVAVITATLLIAALGFANPSRVVAKYNVEAYLSGKLESIDMETIEDLNVNSAVPYVWQLRNDPDEAVRKSANKLLFFALEDHELVEKEEETEIYRLKESSFPMKSFTFSSYEAYHLLQENRFDILLNAVPYMEDYDFYPSR